MGLDPAVQYDTGDLESAVNHKIKLYDQVEVFPHGTQLVQVQKDQDMDYLQTGDESITGEVYGLAFSNPGAVAGTALDVLKAMGIGKRYLNYLIVGLLCDMYRIMSAWNASAY